MASQRFFSWLTTINMLLSPTYPLPQDLGVGDTASPDSLNRRRQNWASYARKRRRSSRRAARCLGFGLPVLLGFFGMLPWVIQWAFQPQQLSNHLSSTMPMGNAHLGAEYYNIASAIYQGRGFADPFVVQSGPTAWMPPLLVWIQAGLIALFSGDRFLVMCVVVAMKTLLLAACGWAVVRQGSRLLDGWIAFAVFAAFILTDFHACFAFTHDGWIILGTVTATVFGATWLNGRLSSNRLAWPHVLLWGCFGGLVAYSSPVAGFSWATATTVCLIRRKPIYLAAAAVMSILVVVPWGVRNFMVLGKFVPMKSNAYFEFDQSLALDQDGLLDWGTMNSHPYHAGKEQEKYVAMGEIAYLETKEQRFKSMLSNNPAEYFAKVRNRLIGTTLWPAGFSGFYSPLRWFLYPWPAIAALALVIFCRPLTSLQRFALIVYVAYLFPYVLCSYYPRYGIPLIIVKVLLCYWVIERIVLATKKSASHPSAYAPSA